MPPGGLIQDFGSNGGAWPPPEGYASVDPHAYETLALGETVEALCGVRNHEPPPPLIPFIESHM